MLDASRNAESRMGNFIADSMVWVSFCFDILDYEHMKSFTIFQYATGERKFSFVLGIMNSGGIRGSLEKGNITFTDMFTVLPFQNDINIFEIKGRHLKETLELSASRLSSDGKNSDGGFIQVCYFL